MLSTKAPGCLLLFTITTLCHLSVSAAPLPAFDPQEASITLIRRTPRDRAGWSPRQQGAELNAVNPVTGQQHDLLQQQMQQQQAAQERHEINRLAAVIRNLPTPQLTLERGARGGHGGAQGRVTGALGARYTPEQLFNMARAARLASEQHRGASTSSSGGSGGASSSYGAHSPGRPSSPRGPH